MTNTDITPHVITAAREWVADCNFLDADYIDSYTDQQILAGIERHYEGGLKQFLTDNQL